MIDPPRRLRGESSYLSRPTPEHPTNTNHPPTPRHHRKHLGLDLSSKRHRKSLHPLPWRWKPLPAADGAGRWLPPQARAIKWLDLFFDVALCGILVVFNDTHSLDQPGAIPSYVTYFILVHWLWTTQVHYDIRYEGNDRFHRLIKGLQLVLFMYMGAISEGWDPRFLLDAEELEPDVEPELRVTHELAGESFKLSASRIQSIALCLPCIVIDGRAIKRPVRREMITTASLVASALCSMTAVVLPANSTLMAVTKLSMLYIAVGLEVITRLVQSYFNATPRVELETLGERYGSLTIVMVSDGFWIIINALSAAVTGMGENSKVTYFQVLLSLGILYFFWSILFADFCESEIITRTRGALWEAVHFPLHLSLVLLLAAMSNVIRCSSWYAATVHAGAIWDSVAAATFTHGVRLNEGTLSGYGTFLDRADPYASFRDEYDAIWEANAYWTQVVGSLERGDFEVLGNATDLVDPHVLLIQDRLNSLDKLATKFSVPHFDRSLVHHYTAIMDAPSAVHVHSWVDLTSEEVDAQLDTLPAQRDHLVLELQTYIVSLLNAALSGVWWLFPSSGISLLLTAARSGIRYRFTGAPHYIVHSLYTGVGIALSLLGLLVLGSLGMDYTTASERALAPMAVLVLDGWALVIVFAGYGVVVLGTTVALSCQGGGVTFGWLNFVGLAGEKNADEYPGCNFDCESEGLQGDVSVVQDQQQGHTRRRRRGER